MSLIPTAPDAELSRSEVATLLGVSDATVRRYEVNGWLKVHRIRGRNKLYLRSDVDAFMATQPHSQPRGTSPHHEANNGKSPSR
jgi:excisionase family DNA binding protein